MRNLFVVIVFYVFGDYKKCKENKLNWCKWFEDFDNVFYNDFLNGKDLKGENLKVNLINLFEVYFSDIVINKFVENVFL